MTDPTVREENPAAPSDERLQEIYDDLGDVDPDEVYAIIEEIQARRKAESASPWRYDLEAAPKDGTNVLIMSDVWGLAGKKGLTLVTAACPAVCTYEPRSGAWSVAHNQNPGMALAYEPYAWMPLPSRPAAPASDVKEEA